MKNEEGFCVPLSVLKLAIEVLNEESYYSFHNYEVRIPVFIEPRGEEIDNIKFLIFTRDGKGSWNLINVLNQ